MPGPDINQDVSVGTFSQDPNNPQRKQREDAAEVLGLSPNAGAVYAELRSFTEQGAGVYTANVDLPLGAVLLDIRIFQEALWDAGTSATMIVGDENDVDGYYVITDLKATDLLASEEISFAFTGGEAGAYINPVGAETSPAGSIERQRIILATEAQRRITGKITSVGAGTAGRTHMTVIYAVPTSVAAAFVAA
jgi:hypothetical protein